ncbi:MAG: glycerol-3-phosphate dehydrogenase subunit GlpB [Thermodesulfobacteriota bacterium]
MEKQDITCDVLIIGAGFAGMAACARASELGLKTIMAGNSSQLYFASGLFDFLGVYPLDPATLLTNPETGLELLKKKIPDHPYSKTSLDAILKSFDFITDFLKSAGLEYKPSKGGNISVLTAAGTFKPTFLVPETIKKCQMLNKSKNLLIIDFKGLTGFSARQIAARLKERHDSVHTLSIELVPDKTVLPPMHIASMFENDDFLEKIAKKISNCGCKADLLGMPAVCGINKSLDILTKLEKMTNLDIFEIPMMPPSIPGLRLKNAFEKQLAKQFKKKSVQFLSQAKIKSEAINENEFILNAVNQNMETRIKTECVVLASGRFQSGGLYAHRKQVFETVFNLPIHQPEHRNLWHNRNLFEKQGHLINTSGIETDNVFRPVDTNGSIFHKNLYAAGTILAHNDWARLKSGSGVSALSAFTAINDFYNRHNPSL